MATIKVYTAAGTNASRVGESYVSDGVVAWRNAVDRVNSDGTGIVFLDVEDIAVADVLDMLDADDDCESLVMMS